MLMNMSLLMHKWTVNGSTVSNTKRIDKSQHSLTVKLIQYALHYGKTGGAVNLISSLIFTT